MTFGIIINERDEYLYSLIKERLTYYYPQAYIDRVGSKDPTINYGLISRLYLLYDNRQITSPEEGNYTLIPLYEDDGKGHMIIDMRRISNDISSFENDKPSLTTEVSVYEDRLKLLISYAYIDERENFIRRAIGPDSFDTIHPIRIDLMSGIRMPTPFVQEAQGSITKLLRDCKGKSFKPQSILDYLNPDSNGFLSAGKPIQEDDVFDIGIEACTRLVSLLRDLCIKENGGALVVAEGWRVSELLRFIPCCDSLHILLPARMCTEDTGMVKELGAFKRGLSSGALMTVHYCEDYREQYESINI
ncbi:MAG: hypothetical protein IJ757_02935 [Clostridiales bacterium]|nr:hypothetical protein [Clostridiales bacterium]